MPLCRDTFHNPPDHTSDVLRRVPRVSSPIVRHFKTPLVVEKQINERALMKNTSNMGVTSRTPVEKAAYLLCQYARLKHPKHADKHLARAADCGVLTARDWLKNEKLPGNKHLFNLMRAWGPDFIAAILKPVNPEAAEQLEIAVRKERLTREVQELQRDMNRLSQE